MAPLQDENHSVRVSIDRQIWPNQLIFIGNRLYSADLMVDGALHSVNGEPARIIVDSLNPRKLMAIWLDCGIP